MNDIIVESDLLFMRDTLGKTMRDLRDSTILITGFAGFMGYYLTLFLLENSEELNIHIIAVDNFELRKPDWVCRIQNVQNISIYAMDATEISDKTVQNLDRVTHIIHMSSIASPVYYRRNPLGVFMANVNGLETLGNLFVDKKFPCLKRMLVLSSSEIYGNPDTANIPTPESYVGNVSCVGPRACYDEAKRVSETLCWIYSNHYGMPVSIIRPFNAFGPGMCIEDKRLPADLASNVLASRDITIYSDGTPSRTFCYITDALCGLLLSLMYPRNEIFNIGRSSPETSVEEFAMLYKKVGNRLFGYNGSIVFSMHDDTAYLVNNPSRRCPDITKACTLLGYSPRVLLEDGIQRYLLFLKG